MCAGLYHVRMHFSKFSASLRVTNSQLHHYQSLSISNLYPFLVSTFDICDPVWEDWFYHLFKVSRNAGFKYLVCCSLLLVEAMCTKF